jgi:hypothetical protein
MGGQFINKLKVLCNSRWEENCKLDVIQAALHTTHHSDSQAVASQHQGTTNYYMLLNHCPFQRIGSQSTSSSHWIYRQISPVGRADRIGAKG